MAKVVINGQEVQPSKKVKLYKKIKATEVSKLIKDKQEELKNK